MGLTDRFWPDDTELRLDTSPLIPQVAKPPIPVDRVGELEERIARAHRVPYWLISSHPRPSILRRPIWRIRAWWWTR